VQCKAQRCYESQSRQLKNEGEKIFPRFARTDGHYPRCLRQWLYHSKNASYGPEGGSRKAFLSLFDLEKAFHTIERQYYCNVTTKKASVAEHGGFSRVATQVQWQG